MFLVRVFFVCTVVFVLCGCSCFAFCSFVCTVVLIFAFVCINKFCICFMWIELMCLLKIFPQLYTFCHDVWCKPRARVSVSVLFLSVSLVFARPVCISHTSALFDVCVLWKCFPRYVHVVSGYTPRLSVVYVSSENFPPGLYHVVSGCKTPARVSGSVFSFRFCLSFARPVCISHTSLCVLWKCFPRGCSYTLCQDVESSNVVYYFVCVSLTPLFCPSVCFSLYVILRKYFTCFLKSFFQEVVPDIVVTVIDQMFHCCWFSFTCTMMHINLLKLG